MMLLLLACGRLADLASSVTEGGTTEAAPAPVPDCASEVPAIPARGCVSGALACGSTISGTTLGGDSAWDDEFYSGAFCFPAGDHHSGSERVYTLTAPADTEVSVRLTSSCVDLDLVAVGWEYEGSCPTAKHLVPDCEGDSKRGGDGLIKIQSFIPRQYLIGVDGKRGAVGSFQLAVTCKPLRSQEDRSKVP